MSIRGKTNLTQETNYAIRRDDIIRELRKGDIALDEINTADISELYYLNKTDDDYTINLTSLMHDQYTNPRNSLSVAVDNVDCVTTIMTLKPNKALKISPVS